MTDWTEDLIGMTFNEGSALAAANGMTLRVVSVDRAPVVVTRDYRTDRLGVALRDGRIVGVRGVG